MGAITYLGITCFLCLLAAYVKLNHHHVPSRSVYSREFPVEPLAGPARSSVLKTCRSSGLTHVHFSEALFDAPLRNDVGRVVRIRISKETVVRHDEHDGGEAPFRN